MNVPTVKKYNNYVSYLKGFAILAVMVIHLCDWSNLQLGQTALFLKEFLYTSVLFFISTLGSVVYIAYSRYADWQTPTKKLLKRGLQLIAVYFVYSLIKLYFYNFSAEPFYGQFVAAGKLTLSNIVQLKIFDAPISIILTIAVFLVISPVFLWIAKKAKHPREIILAILLVVLAANYLVAWPQNVVTDFLYAKNNITFPVALWLAPYLIGFWLAMNGFEKQKIKHFCLFAVLAVLIFFGQSLGSFWRISGYMYPLQPFYVAFGFAFMYFLFMVFYWLECWRNALAERLLAILKILGDHTLFLYVGHWVVIDLVLATRLNAKLIWPAVILFLAIFLFIKRKDNGKVGQLKVS